MSLLLKALQNAAKNREAATPGARAGASPEPREATPANELSLEPVQPAPRPQAAPRSRIPAPEDVVERTPGPSPLQAQTVLRASAKPQGPSIFAWFAQRPLVTFSTAAGLFAIGYGVYLYLQLTNPGVFTATRTPPPPPPAAIATAPPPLQPPAGAVQPLAPVPGPSLEPIPVPGASGTPASATTPSIPGSALAPAAPPPSSMQAPAPTSVTPSAGASIAPAPGAAPIGAPPVATAPEARMSAPPAGAIASIGKPSVAAAKPAGDPTPGGRPRAAARAPTGKPPAQRESPDAVAAAGGSQIIPVDAALASAYQALEKGRLDDAERLYRQVTASNPGSVDGMLGLASTLAQQNKGDQASQLYLRVLEQDPRNAYAQAGLLNIAGRADPPAAEARLKQLIAREPSAFLYFTLGNLYSEQGQWAGAQSAYFQAHNLAPDNPDYAFNLAVGLEHVSQPKIALDYYRRAAALAQTRGHAQFDLTRVQTRIRSLEAALAEKP